MSTGFNNLYIYDREIDWNNRGTYMIAVFNNNNDNTII